MTERTQYPLPAPVAEWLARLEANGYRLTAPRRAVVEIIALSQHVLTPLISSIRPGPTMQSLAW